MYVLKIVFFPVSIMFLLIFIDYDTVSYGITLRYFIADTIFYYIDI